MPGRSGASSCSLVKIRSARLSSASSYSLRHRQRAGRAGLDAQPAEDAAQVVDLVDRAVPLAGREARLLGVVGALDVDGVGRAGPGAQLAADALLQAVRVPVEHVPAVVARRRSASSPPGTARSSTFLNIVPKVTPKPLTGLRKSDTVHLLSVLGSTCWARPTRRHAAAPSAAPSTAAAVRLDLHRQQLLVRQRRNREPARVGVERRLVRLRLDRPCAAARTSPARAEQPAGWRCRRAGP